MGKIHGVVTVPPASLQNPKIPHNPNPLTPIVFKAPAVSQAGQSNAIGEHFTIPDRLYAQYAIQPTEQIALGALYGIGIGKAILREELMKNHVTTFPPVPGYNPDAMPNPNGGFDKTSNWDGYMSSSLPGMPVMCYLKLKGGSYTDLQGDVIDFPDIIFETVLISLTMGKDLKKTKILGRNTGTVKEYNGQGDWDIEIKAIITADAPVNEFVPRSIQSGKYPRDNMHQVWQMLQAPIAIPVECWYLNMFDINYIVINEGTRISQIQGEYNLQRLEIPALSDHPLVITLSS